MRRKFTLTISFMLLLGVFAVPPTQAKTYDVLYSFTGREDGSFPNYGTLVRDRAGNLYGTTEFGGNSGCGVVFLVTPSGEETVLYSFNCMSDGGNPTYGGSSGSPGYGVVFSLTIKNSTYAVLYNFTGSTDGAYPLGALSEGPGGILYGTTIQGGSSGNGGHGQGVVFEVAPESGKESVLYTFTGEPNGEFPVGGVIPNKAGKLFGTTQAGGVSQWGTVYELDPKKGTDTVLFRFEDSDGAYPLAGLVRDSKGNFYGTADGGEFQGGVVFSIYP